MILTGGAAGAADQAGVPPAIVRIDRTLEASGARRWIRLGEHDTPARRDDVPAFFAS